MQTLQITVDMVCEASTVSQRTFFNYFGSKEGVILGATPPMPANDAIDAFVHMTGSNVLGDFLTLLMSSVVDRELDADLFKARRTLIMRTPELLTKETARMSEFEEQFMAIILSRFAFQERTVAEPELEDQARMVVSLTTGVLHYVMRKRFGAQPTASTRELLRGSIDLIHRITNDAPQPTKGTSPRP